MAEISKKEQERLDKLNSIIMELSSDLAEDMAQDEMYANELLSSDDDMYQDDGSGKGTIYTDKAQDIFNRWYDYFMTKIKTAIV